MCCNSITVAAGLCVYAHIHVMVGGCQGEEGAGGAGLRGGLDMETGRGTHRGDFVVIRSVPDHGPIIQKTVSQGGLAM